MMLSTPGLVLHTSPYSESSVVVKVFTRQLGLRSYIIKGVRGPRGRVKQNLLQPLSSLDMVVYDNDKTDLNYVKELSARFPSTEANPVANSLRFFMTELLYKALRESEPMPALYDYVENASSHLSTHAAHLPISFLLTVAHHLGIEPLDNYSAHEPYFCLEEGRFVAAPNETSLSPNLSAVLHEYLSGIQSFTCPVSLSLQSRRDLIDALISYYHLHLSGFSRFHSHEILHTILK
jgi:DNA repair protein RecO (recombination protein O)